VEIILFAERHLRKRRGAPHWNYAAAQKYAKLPVLLTQLLEPEALRQLYDSRQLAQHLLHYFCWRLRRKLRSPGAPVEALDLIREYHTTDFATLGQAYLEGITLHLRSNRATDCQSSLTVVRIP
jgi:hypothetical protein